MPQISALTRKVRSLHRQKQRKAVIYPFLSFPFLALLKDDDDHHHHFSHETAKFYQTQILRMATRLIDQAFSSSTPPPPRIPSFPNTQNNRSKKKHVPFLLLLLFLLLCLSVSIYFSLCWSVGSWRWRGKRKKL